MIAAPTRPGGVSALGAVPNSLSHSVPRAGEPNKVTSGLLDGVALM